MRSAIPVLLAVPLICSLLGPVVDSPLFAKRPVTVSRSRPAEHAVTIQDVDKDVHDADTFYCDIDLDFGVVLAHQQVRCSDFDAWEVSRVRRTVNITEEELVLGRKARHAVRELLRSAESVTVESQRPLRDNYGRLLVRVRVDGNLLADFIKDNGYARDTRFD